MATTSPWRLSGHSATLRVGEFSAAVKVDQPGLGIHDIAWAGEPIEAIHYWLALKEPGPLPAETVRDLEEAYIRGRDLVAIYVETKEHPLRYIVYWRSLEEDQLCGAAAGVDVVVSVQTSALDIKPAVWLSSQFGVERAWSGAAADRIWRSITAEVWTDPMRDRSDPERILAVARERLAAAAAATDEAFLFDLTGELWSCGEMIHPRDRMASYAAVAEFPGVPPRRVEPSERNVETNVLRAAVSSHSVLGLPLEKGVLLRARLRAVLARRENAKEVVAASREAFERAELPLTT